MEKVIYINLCFRLMIMKWNGVSFTLHCCCHRHRRCTSMIHNTRKYWNERTNERTKREHKMFPSENASFSDEWSEMKLSLSRTTSSKKNIKRIVLMSSEVVFHLAQRFMTLFFMLEMPSEAAIYRERLKHSTSLDSLMRHFFIIFHGTSPLQSRAAH